MTRQEHLKWCKERAIQEFDFTLKKEGMATAVRDGLASMVSDMNRHAETRSDSLSSLCLMIITTIKSRQQFINFINGFN